VQDLDNSTYVTQEFQTMIIVGRSYMVSHYLVFNINPMGDGRNQISIYPSDHTFMNSKWAFIGVFVGAGLLTIFILFFACRVLYTLLCRNEKKKIKEHKKKKRYRKKI